ncbi:hypothetical protein ABK040_011366 [Willaertia magna]
MFFCCFGKKKEGIKNKQNKQENHKENDEELDQNHSLTKHDVLQQEVENNIENTENHEENDEAKTTNNKFNPNVKELTTQEFQQLWKTFELSTIMTYNLKKNTDLVITKIENLLDDSYLYTLASGSLDNDNIFKFYNYCELYNNLFLMEMFINLEKENIKVKIKYQSKEYLKLFLELFEDILKDILQ